MFSVADIELSTSPAQTKRQMHWVIWR